jgi:hypothetical protein
VDRAISDWTSPEMAIKIRGLSLVAAYNDPRHRRGRELTSIYLNPLATIESTPNSSVACTYNVPLYQLITLA